MGHIHQRSDALSREISLVLGEAIRSSKGLDKAQVVFETPKPVAYDSPDYIKPVGTYGFSSADAFNLLALYWIPANELAVMDLGCAGGAMVGDFYDLGCLAIGVEGTDYQKRVGSGNWGRLPNNLFTADISVPFDVHLDRDGQRERVKFSLVTSWEVLEHIRTPEIAAVMDNIERHLALGGVIVMSICPISDAHDGVELHQTIQPMEWWVDHFEKLGFRHHPEIVEYFGAGMVRGGELETGGPSFHVALTRADEEPMHKDRLVDRQVDSRALAVSREEYEVTYWRVIGLENRIGELEKLTKKKG